MLKLDAQDQKILEDRMARREAALHPEVPAVGDWVRLPDGGMTRVAEIWQEIGIQLSWSMTSGFYLAEFGNLNYSGTLLNNPSMHKLEKFSLTEETRTGHVWFFHHDRHVAGNAVQAFVNLRVWNLEN
jgi:hypothetical protein